MSSIYLQMDIKCNLQNVISLMSYNIVIGFFIIPNTFFKMVHLQDTQIYYIIYVYSNHH